MYRLVGEIVDTNNETIGARLYNMLYSDCDDFPMDRVKSVASKELILNARLDKNNELILTDMCWSNVPIIKGVGGTCSGVDAKKLQVVLVSHHPSDRGLSKFTLVDGNGKLYHLVLKELFLLADKGYSVSNIVMGKKRLCVRPKKKGSYSEYREN